MMWFDFVNVRIFPDSLNSTKWSILKSYDV
jgi:hypothetical protein